jgi:hypothetical protein
MECGFIYMLGRYNIDASYITSLSLPPLYSGIVRVINEMEWAQQMKHVKPASDLKPWLGIELQHNAHLRCDCVGNFWFWETATDTPSYISSQFIIHTVPTTVDMTALKRVLLNGETNLNTRVKLPEGMMVKNMTEDFFKLTTEDEFKIDLNSNYSYVAKRDVAGYKKGNIILCQKFDMMTGDPLVIDLNTGKEIRMRYDDYESRNNTEYLKMRQDN